MKTLRNAVLVLCVLVTVAGGWQALRKSHTLWDLKAYCGAIEAIQAGLDPYYIENVERFSGNTLIIAYPVATLLFISPACIAPRVTYPVLMTALLIVVWFMVRRLWPEDPVLLAVLLFTGFGAFHANLLTGNLGVMELAGFAMAMICVHRKRYFAAGIWLGLIVAAKLLPAAFAAVLVATVLREDGWRSARHLVAGSLLGFASLHGISLLISVRYEYSMVQVLLGNIPEPGKFTPMREWAANWTTPALPLVIKDVVKALEWPWLVAFAGYAILALGCGCLFFKMWHREFDRWTLFAYGVLFACILLPRFKPYTFVYALLPLYYLLHRQQIGAQAAVLAVAGAIPVLAYYNPLDSYVRATALKIPLSTTPMMALLAVLILLLWVERARWSSASAGATRRL